MLMRFGTGRHWRSYSCSMNKMKWFLFEDSMHKLIWYDFENHDQNDTTDNSFFQQRIVLYESCQCHYLFKNVEEKLACHAEELKYKEHTHKHWPDGWIPVIPIFIVILSYPPVYTSIRHVNRPYLLVILTTVIRYGIVWPNKWKDIIVDRLA